MNTHEPNGRTSSGHEARIEELKGRAQEQAGGEMSTWTSESLTPDLEEQFWQNVVAYEEAPDTTHFEELEEAGVELPAPETLSDEELSGRLWEMIHGLARIRVFLSCTDHLSDRELYTVLWREHLRQPTKAMPRSEFSAWHLDLVGTGSEEDNLLYMKYYADEESRRHWLSSFPDYAMPDSEVPPYDRDARLPQATYG